MAKTYTRRVPKLDPNGQRIGLYLEPQDAALLAELQRALGAERGGTVTLNETMREAIRYRANARAITKWEVSKENNQNVICRGGSL